MKLQLFEDVYLILMQTSTCVTLLARLASNVPRSFAIFKEENLTLNACLVRVKMTLHVDTRKTILL